MTLVYVSCLLLALFLAYYTWLFNRFYLEFQEVVDEVLSALEASTTDGSEHVPLHNSDDLISVPINGDRARYVHQAKQRARDDAFQFNLTDEQDEDHA